MKGKHKDLVFPSIRKQTALCDMVLTSFLRRINAPSDIPDRVATAHGFRSSFRDWCSEHVYSVVQGISLKTGTGKPGACFASGTFTDGQSVMQDCTS